MANKIIGSIPYSIGYIPLTPGDPESALGVHAVAQSRETEGLRLLAKHMSEHNMVFSQGVINGVLSDMVGCIVELLRSGYSVSLDGLCKFSNSITSETMALTEGENKPTDYPAAKIKKVSLRCSIAEEANSALNTDTEFEYVMTRKEQQEAKKKAKEGIFGTSTDGTGGTGGGDDGGDGVTE